MASTDVHANFCGFCFLLASCTPFLLLLLFQIPSKLTGKLLNKIFPVPQKAALIKDVYENDEELKLAAESCESLLYSEKANDKPIQYSNESVKKYFLCILPTLFCVLIHYFIVLYYFYTFDRSGIIRSYGTPDISYYPRTICIRSKPVISNPCNATDSEEFQNFVILWKKQNEVQMKLDKWKDVINDSDTPSTMKEYYNQKIEAAEENINASSATLESNFQIYKNCFLKKNDSIRNSIIIYYFLPWIILNFLISICCPVQIHCSSYLNAKGLLGRREFIATENFSLDFPTQYGFFTSLATLFFYKMTLDQVPEEFLV